LLATRFVFRTVLPFSHETAAILVSLALSLAVLVDIWVVRPRERAAITSSLSSSSSSDTMAPSLLSSSFFSASSSSLLAIDKATRRAVTPFKPFYLMAMANLVSTFWFIVLSAVPWPRSFWISLGCWLGNLVTYVSSLVSPDFGFMMLFGTGLILFGGVILFMFAAAANKERRDDFVGSLMLERELGLISAEKAATDSITNALFPPGIAERLIRSQRIAAMPDQSPASFADPSSGNQTVSGVYGSVEMSTRSTGTFVHEPIADSFKSATVLFVSIDGVEDVRPYDSQLQLLSEIFIAADHVAEAHDAIKIKSIGNVLEFVCGLPKQDLTDTHTSRCCELAVDLVRMLHQFCKDRAIEETISLRAGIATGPVVAGVIGVSRPRYDVWGHTTTIAERLMEIAPKWGIFVTRDISNTCKHLFKFRMAKGTTVVQGVGKLTVFTLEPAPTNQPFVVNTTPVSFALPHIKQQALWDVAKQRLREKKDISTIPFMLFFRKRAREMEYMRVYTARYLPFMRWFALAIGILNVVYMLYSALRGIFTPDRWVVNTLYSVLFYVMFILTFVKPLAARPFTFWAVQSAIAFAFIGLEIVMWDTGMWVDSTISGMAASLFFLTASRLHFFTDFVLNVVLFIGTLYMWTLGYNRMSSALYIMVFTLLLTLHHDFEKQSRRVFSTNRTLRKGSRTTKNEREKAHALLTTAVPAKILETLMHTTEDIGNASKASYLAEFVPSGTVLVCQIVGFDELYRRCSPFESVCLLNALFSHLDGLTHARGLEPLKTIADEYVVVGNLLNDVPTDHAERIVGLATDIILSVGTFNSSINPTGVPIALRIGIHTDSIVSRLFLFLICF